MKTAYVLDKFNNKAKEWLEDLERVDNEKIQLRPAEKSWSFAEVFDHIMKVARNYQIPNLKKSVSDSPKRKRKKGFFGFAVFNFGYRRNIHLKMEKFPQWMIDLFTPENRSKEDLLKDFKDFIKEVNDLEEILINSTSKNKNHHPLFGDINTKEWFSLIEQHMWQHDKQLRKLKEFLKMKEVNLKAK